VSRRARAQVVVPVGLPLLRTGGLVRLRGVWPVVGAVAGVALLLAPGAVAASLTVPYLALTGVAAGLALRRAVTARHELTHVQSALRELTALTAGTSLLVAAGSLTAERAGYRLLGFDGEVLALTAAHFHYAGFAVATLAGLVLVRVPGRPAVLAAVAVPTGTALVAAGHFLGRAVELAGALALTTGLLALSLTTLRQVLPRRRAARRLLVVAAGVTPLTMGLAVWWALGRLTGLPHPDLALTAATHGVGNAVGVCLCGLLGWRLLRPTAL
jgi:hypothetical protein